MSSEADTQGRNLCAFDAVLLDAAGTLIRPRKPVGETYAEIAASYGATLQSDRLMQAFVEVFRNMPDLAFEWASKDELRRLERDWWRTLVHRVVVGTGSSVGDFDGFFETLYQHYAHGQAWQCFPEVPVVLRALRGKGYRIAVVSNFDSRLPGILDALGIREQMDAVVYSSEAGSAKPDPVIFQRALDALGVAPERAIHIGDNPRADLDGASAAGLAGLLIQRGRWPVAAAQTIRNLGEFLDRIEKPSC